MGTESEAIHGPSRLYSLMPSLPAAEASADLAVLPSLETSQARRDAFHNSWSSEGPTEASSQDQGVTHSATHRSMGSLPSLSHSGSPGTTHPGEVLAGERSLYLRLSRVPRPSQCFEQPPRMGGGGQGLLQVPPAGPVEELVYI